MDIGEIRQQILKLRALLKKNRIKSDIFILYGSYASGKNRIDSDIDIAVISRDFGFDRFKEGSRLNYLASKIDPRIEAVPIGLDDYLSTENISPLLNEVHRKGIVIL